ncbi:TonB-dependent receptor [Desulfosarcina ovata subsp. sediminis]|uniref:TonB-dependent receptor n=1 Tax=Desulfosarcina ovata subsp. sediminis TaxID=885957 RepID=A0A5K7ZJN0_9BACT|nr:TonB-dependent receptor [Desulfosarcina ovata subsp. sediminis]
MEAITVTAEKQEEEVQKVPSAITVFTETALEDAGIDEIGEVIKQVPNMNYGETYLGRETIFRGIRPSQFTGKNPVVIYIDGIPHDHVNNFDVDLNNIERVEVLRGSQGALYGKNAIGGIINVISKQPDNLFNSKVTAECAENKTYKAKAYVDGPIVKDRLFLGLSGSWSETEGFMENNYPGEENFDGNDILKTKALLNWLPTDCMKIALHAGANRIRNHNGAVIRSDEVRYSDTRAPDDKMDTDILNLGLNLSYEWNELELTSVSTFSDNETNARQNFNYYRQAAAWIGYGDKENSLFSQEIRFQSKDNDNGLKWLGGVYYSKDEGDINESGSIMNTEASLGYNTKKNYPGATEEETVSAFGQITIPLIKKVHFTAGLRYEQVHKELNFRYKATRLDTNQTLTTVAYDIDDDWSAFLPKGVLAWDVNDNALIYASVSKGYLAGGLNTYESDKDRTTFDEQTSIDYEVGAKTQWLENRLAFNITAFYMDIEDMHVYNMPEPYVFVATNAGEAHSKGIELEVRARPLKGLDITAQFGWIDAEYDEYEGYEGNKIQGTPEYTINLAAQYRHASGLFGRAEMQGNGETYYNDGNTDSQDSFEVYNLKIGYEASRWDLYFYCKNILDEEYFSYGRSCGIGTLKEVGDPRTFGLIASVNF